MKKGYALARLLTLGFLKLFFDFKVYGQENIPSFPVLIVANHCSYLDPPIVGCAFQKEIYFVARKTLFDSFLLGKLIGYLNTIPLDRDKPEVGSFRLILDLFEKEKSILIFPEGTRSPSGTLQKAAPGVGYIAAKAKVAVLPIRIFGSFEAFPRTAKIPKPHPIRVVIGKPYWPMPCPPGLSKKSYYQNVADEMMEKIASLRFDVKMDSVQKDLLV
ncbi:1-acyl-sn-glycerol-3-phosphate acyltransferase [Candidatus Methylacidiphilum fumarolicum]|uniref:1-acyl-sn-glycerol-3-phosphate acyltransferase n=2 Tax=Candidatus Methylacidiphilum fumarolicum TaxID=591154 RepID=I0JWH9_METFB|nr:lysophospholipid acyltransferase family protein [Candidatus Methylacidiphilum fumarolicum]MBW6415350.1 1-acyl-sn-glycerol-3-phosphate acyltransferase [Candidatus Methylacidiphilum fumarolicum]TFE68679.1 acyl-phosphate glycerol 3-phosphate acyltransferase [Candidatus Methylacidiphilum fumarolicum]TFE72564.1 1-acyl-sn-glycerol-3-phosphate acyltransferase [Candidatus Methylacidiphilum fumarolicum]TFE73881.1 1-acyl-sn-glycerol-3-phosphate acyltransferase [Candidatus Methylacidiphilum fumarolicum